MKMSKRINLNQGTINFWVDEDDLYKRERELASKDTENGGVRAVIKEGKLNFTHIMIGEGRRDIEVYLDNYIERDKQHMVQISWDIEDRIAVYVDGELIQDEPF
jgi:hypothetical protein